jgi:hypothetical protein
MQPAFGEQSADNLVAPHHDAVNGESSAVTGELDRRVFPRYDSRAQVRIIRASDRMRFGVSGEVWNISVEGAGIVLKDSLRLGEQVTLELSNVIQRFQCEVRGTILWCEPEADGRFRLGVRFLRRISPLDVSSLRGRPRDDTDRAPTWV